MRSLNVPLRFLATLAVVILATLPTPRAISQESTQRIVVHLSHYADNLHAASMALSLAANLRQGGTTVTVFLDLEGVRLADVRVPQDLRWGTTAPMAELYGAFVKAGGAVLLCAHCAHAAGVDSANLREGARIGTDAQVRELFMAADKIVDY